MRVGFISLLDFFLEGFTIISNSILGGTNFSFLTVVSKGLDVVGSMGLVVSFVAVTVVVGGCVVVVIGDVT